MNLFFQIFTRSTEIVNITRKCVIIIFFTRLIFLVLRRVNRYID